MTTCVWFTFPRDYEKLSESVARVRLLDPDALCLAVIPQEVDPPTGIDYVRRSFDRGSHLNGEAAIRGVARTLAQVTGDLVVKLDSDMIPARAYWLDGPTVFQRWNGSFVGTYALPPRVFDVVNRCIERVQNPGTEEASAICFRAIVALNAFELPYVHYRLGRENMLPPEIHCI
jgi:hypothetical protein